MNVGHDLVAAPLHNRVRAAPARYRRVDADLHAEIVGAQRSARTAP